MEEEADGKALGEEGAEILSPKRKVIRAESEETQDYVKESLNLIRDEAEETSFLPSAFCIPQRPKFWCDNRCSDNALKFWQFASVVVEDGKESYTANLCQQCYNESMSVSCSQKFLDKRVKVECSVTVGDRWRRLDPRRDRGLALWRHRVSWLCLLSLALSQSLQRCQR